MSATDTPSSVTKINPRDERRRILKSPNYNRMGFKDEKQSVEEIMIKEFTLIRQSNRFLFENMSEEQSYFTANVNGEPLSARAIAFIMIGHVNHHLQVMQERY